MNLIRLGAIQRAGARFISPAEYAEFWTIDFLSTRNFVATIDDPNGHIRWLTHVNCESTIRTVLRCFFTTERRQRSGFQRQFTMAHALRAAYIRLGFSGDGATALRDSQGIDSLTELKLLSDEECVNACRAIRSREEVKQVKKYRKLLRTT